MELLIILSIILLTFLLKNLVSILRSLVNYLQFFDMKLDAIVHITGKSGVDIIVTKNLVSTLVTKIKMNEVSHKTKAHSKMMKNYQLGIAGENLKKGDLIELRMDKGNKQRIYRSQG